MLSQPFEGSGSGSIQPNRLTRWHVTCRFWRPYPQVREHLSSKILCCYNFILICIFWLLTSVHSVVTYLNGQWNLAQPRSVLGFLFFPPRWQYLSSTTVVVFNFPKCPPRVHSTVLILTPFDPQFLEHCDQFPTCHRYGEVWMQCFLLSTHRSLWSGLLFKSRQWYSGISWPLWSWHLTVRSRWPQTSWALSLHRSTFFFTGFTNFLGCSLELLVIVVAAVVVIAIH